MINLVLQSFGKESEYRRALLTVLSFYAYNSLPLHETKVILFTDKPEYFETYLEVFPVEYVLLTPEKIKEMRGAIDFLHRIKIAVIEQAFSMIEGNMLYADSDTFFIADPTDIVNQASPQKSFMHVWEYNFENMRTLPMPMGETFHAFLMLIESNRFKLTNGKELKIDNQQVSWNAGVMIFHPSHARFIPDVYALTDQFYPPTRNHASEQYAFSVMLQNNTEIRACDTIIYHYWYRVKKQIIDLFLNEKFTSQWKELPISTKLDDVRQWTRMLPDYFNLHILTERDNAIQAFNEDRFNEGYKHAWKALMTAPFNFDFIRDLLYHTKRRIVKKGI